MSITIKKKIECKNCNGTGRENGDSCEQCGGEGRVSAYGLAGELRYLLSVLKDELQNHLAIYDVIPTYKILEVTDSNEYAALDANKKHWYDLFISAGTLDMNDGTKAQGVFLDWLFPPGTITNAALMAIL